MIQSTVWYSMRNNCWKEIPETISYKNTFPVQISYST